MESLHMRGLSGLLRISDLTADLQTCPGIHRGDTDLWAIFRLDTWYPVNLDTPDCRGIILYVKLWLTLIWMAVEVLLR